MLMSQLDDMFSSLGPAHRLGFLAATVMGENKFKDAKSLTYYRKN